MVQSFIILWVVFHTVVLAIGFGIGLAVGLKVPIIGDAIAMLVVGGLLMVMQYSLLNRQFEITQDWIKYSFVGLILGVGLAFIFIQIFSDSIGLAETHVWGLPIALFILAFCQSFVLRNAEIKRFDNLFVWPIVSLIALILAALILFAINSQFNLAFDLLGDRRQELDKIPRWGITGAIIGLVYGLITGYLLNTS